MTYYKIISNGQIIDVNSVFLRWQSRHGVMLACEAEDGQFIAPRDGSAVWHPAWLNPVPEGAIYDGDIEAIEIEVDEYRELLTQLSVGCTVELPDGTQDETADSETDVTNSDNKNPSSASLPVVDIKAVLEEQANLKEQVQMLTECVLEMSEEIYA